MRPYLENEEESLMSINTMGQGQIQLRDVNNEIDIFPNSNYPGQNTKQQKRMRFDQVFNQECQ